jgi:hypothetical protein
MRVAGFAILGVLAGAVVGLIAAVILSSAAPSGGDGMGGMAAALFLMPLLALVGAVVGGIWFARRARRGSVGTVLIGVAAILVLLGVVSWLGPMIYFAVTEFRDR